MNANSGIAYGILEGKTDVLLSNHITAASQVYVSKIKFVEIDEASRKHLIIRFDESSAQHERRIRLKLYLED